MWKPNGVLYIDDTLEDKVKFTILATGFGVKDVPGMEKVIAKHTEEELEIIKQEEEKQEEKDRRRTIVYEMNDR